MNTHDTNSNLERAVLAGGCFWGMQDLIRKMDGVVSTRVGYTGGDVPNATYRHHGTHAEAIEIVFDPARTSYRTLLEFFFQIHDPTTKNRQGNDVGTSYRSAIYTTSDEQRQEPHQSAEHEHHGQRNAHQFRRRSARPVERTTEGSRQMFLEPEAGPLEQVLGRRQEVTPWRTGSFQSGRTKWQV